MDIVAKFVGGSADEHLLPAFEGAQSLEGLARAITLVSHYVVTGDIRKRRPFTNAVPIYMAPSREGSFEGIFSFLTDENTRFVTTALGTLAVGVTGGLIVELLKVVSKRLVGQAVQPEMAQIRQLLEERGGDVEALGEAVEPALKNAHTAIGNGVGQVLIISGSNNVVNFNQRTKEYISNTVVDNSVRQLMVSVGMLNVNTRNGRVYNRELGRTVPIYVDRNAESRTLSNLARSLQLYSRRNLRQLDSEVVIIFTTERSPDGDDKKYLVRDAYFITE